MSKKVVIVAAARTPIGSFMGALSSVSAPRLGAAAIKGAMQKINLNPHLVDAVLMGHVVQAGAGQATARQAAIMLESPILFPVQPLTKYVPLE
jgi:acetyl-CoA C-acetyltransferase